MEHKFLKIIHFFDFFFGENFFLLLRNLVTEVIKIVLNPIQKKGEKRRTVHQTFNLSNAVMTFNRMQSVFDSPMEAIDR